jgi:transposase InsO family protein
MLGVGNVGRLSAGSAGRRAAALLPWPLDPIATAAAAYAGPGIRVRRSSDNAETDIGFASSQQARINSAATPVNNDGRISATGVTMTTIGTGTKLEQAFVGRVEGQTFGTATTAPPIDPFSRQVVGWRMQPHMQASLVTDALRMAWFRRQPEPVLIFHSDLGSHNCSHSFQEALASCGMLSSMSRKGNCWDIAPTESLWGSLKVGRLYGTKSPPSERR